MARFVLLIVFVAAALSAFAASYVLVVEDTASIRDALVDSLREHGMQAVAVVDGGDALEHLRDAATLPSAILTDLMMPSVDGWELIAALRADARLADIPVVAMTASPFATVPEGIPLLRKPFHWQELECALRGS